MTSTHPETRLVVDGSRCDGHGMCALVMPERIALDRWGYATVDPEPLSDPLTLARARRAVHSCPAQALTVLGDPRSSPGELDVEETGRQLRCITVSPHEHK